MTAGTKNFTPRMVLATIAVLLFGAQWLFGEPPLWLFAAPMNLLAGVLWLAVIYEGYRRRATSKAAQYLLSAEATYMALAMVAIVAVVLGLQSEPASTSWPVIGALLFAQTVLSLVILRGWRNESGVRWRFLIIHFGLWLALMSALLGASDKQVLRVQVGSEPTREALNEQGEKHFLDYELRLENFVMEHSESGAPERFCATVAVDDKVVEIEVNSPYSVNLGEDIYLVSYTADGCVLQIVRDTWRIVTTIGIAILLLGAFVLFMKGFQNRER